jgi:predicted pyridoxine 5'-phosphate oxidase superfamily flavin-nucleotide-binding protein
MCAEEIFHDGELEVQRRAGVAAVAARVGEANLVDSVPPGFADFLSERFFVVVGSADPDGHVWASLLIGPPGFIRTVDSRHLTVMAEPLGGDPLQRSVDAGPAAVGLLALDTGTRSRIRVNGLASRRPGGGLVIEVSEVFGNCPKYIQRRTPVSLIGEGEVGDRRVVSTTLDGPQSSLIGAADTFFIASLHPDRGADASHRGGRPGFVRVQPDGRSLSFPDYAGNSMFQTLGNLHVDGRAGLLFIDWEGGDTLQLSGRATIAWDAETIAVWPGAQRVVQFAIEAVQQHQRALPLRWELLERHRLNPPAPGDIAEEAGG